MKKILIPLFMFLFFYNISYAKRPQVTQRYKIIKSIYLMGTYDSRNDKKLSRETAHAYLSTAELAIKSYTAFQCQVPVGTIMTIVGPVPSRWFHIFFSDRYIVKLDPDVSQGLDVELQLDYGMEGDLDGLNSEIFNRM